MRLITMMANMCACAQEHWEDAFTEAPASYNEERMEATSYAVACFLAQHTKDGYAGVDWDVVLHELVGVVRTPAQWRKIIGSLVRRLGGLKKKGRRRGRV